MVKFLKWVLPLALSSVVMMPLIATQPLQEDDVLTTVSQPPTRSALLSNRYTQMETDDRVVSSNAFATIDGYTYRGSFLGYGFYDKTSDASFRIVEELSGYVWASSVDYDYFLDDDSPLADEGDLGFNLYWQNKLRSPFFLTYYQGLNLREEHAFENVRSTLEVTRTDQPDAVGFDVDVSLFLSKISFTYSVRFGEEGLVISLPFSSITEGDDFSLSTISLYPMLGATKRLRTPGYVVIPDGVGALIRYEDDPSIGVYSKRFYGDDIGLNTTNDGQPLFANMYGLVHGHRQHAMLGIVEDGAAHGILNHFGSQVFLDFNFTYVTFAYRTTYRQYLNQAKTSSVNLLQEDASVIDIGLRYQFLRMDEATYVGLANAFADWRFQDDIPMTLPEEMPLHIDVLALESKPGLLTRQKVVMTDIEALSLMIEELQSEVTDELRVNYLGWQDGGYSYTAPNQNAIDSSLGTLSDLTTFNNGLLDTSTQLRLAIDPYRAYTRGRGYTNQDILQSIGQEFIQHGAYYHLTESAGDALRIEIKERLASWGFAGAAIETIGERMASHFGQDITTKQASVDHLQNQLTLEDGVYRPMSYSWGAGQLFDMPMYSSEQRRLTDTIPLIPYMIKGHRQGFGRAGNFFSNTSNELLRMIDYGLYPAFFITEASAYDLIDTGSENIFTSRYLDWQPEIQRQYDFLSEALQSTIGQKVLQREVLGLGVVELIYENETKLYINYSGNDFLSEDGIVPSLGYLVQEGI